MNAKTISAVLEVQDWNRSHSISVNTRLLLALDRSSLPLLTNTRTPRVWMTPVGLYKGISRETLPKNRVSFIDIKVRSGATLQEIQEQAKKQLQDLNYWGTILTMHISVLLGKKLFTWFSKYLHLTFRRTGTFSNLGEWSISGLAEDEWWVLGEGVVAKMSPVEATAITLNGRMGLSVHFHESLGLSSEEAQKFVESWRDNYHLISSEA